jgi:putative endonuclease
MKEHHYYTYILTRERNSVFYVGVTKNLIRRVYEHKEGLIPGFTKK